MIIFHVYYVKSETDGEVTFTSPFLANNYQNKCERGNNVIILSRINSY